MKIPSKHLVIESLVVGALTFYVAMAMAVLVGLIIWMLGGQEIVLKASWVRWCATIALVPVALRLVFRPETRVIGDRYKTWMAGWRKHRSVTLSYKKPFQHMQKEHRQYPRCPVEYPARLSTDRCPCGFAMIADLSVNGCRVKSKTIVASGDFGKILIYVPTKITPLKVSLTSVRWVSGHECGLKFILMDLDEQGCLNRCLTHAKSTLEPVIAVGT
jgi:PilZ domain